MTRDPRLHHDAAGGREQAVAAEREPARARKSIAQGRCACRRRIARAVWPAFFAARSTWLTKLLDLPARVLRMRPGRTRKSSPVPLIADCRGVDSSDSAEKSIEIIEHICLERHATRPTGTEKDKP